MSYAVQCTDLTKDFKKTKALDGVNFNIKENKIYGFLGRNGAGKTTLLNIISSQIFKTSGELKVFGEEPYENQKILSKICFVKDRMTFMSSHKVKQIFKIASDFFENWDEDFKNELVKNFGLDVNKKYKALSKGMESMVGIIIGLASRAPLTIFDEAYLGLDAAARQYFYDIILEDYMENPRTIIFSTHLIDEVSNIFEKIIIIHKGKVILQDEIDNIRNKAFSMVGKEDVLQIILKNKNILNEKDFGNLKEIFVFDHFDSDELKQLELQGVTIKPMSLQSFFIHMTDK